MEGLLIRYGPKPAQVAFVSSGQQQPQQRVGGNAVYKKVLVAVGGLSCGLMFTDYVDVLGKALPEKAGWTLVQPLLSSSHTGWGMGSVSEDAAEIHELLGVMSRQYGSEHVILLGHSTGCQDAVLYANTYGSKLDGQGFSILGIILQGPVSDREFLKGYLDDSTYTSTIRTCKEMVKQGKEDEVAFVFREWNTVVPISARRWLSLADVGGEDDMFSSDFSTDERAAKLQSLRGIQTLVLMSGADECQVPYGIDPKGLGQLLKDAIGSSARLCVIQGGSHDLSNHAQEVSEVILEFVTTVSS